MTHAALHDPRTTLARPDLAELALEGVLEARAYRAATPMQCSVPAVAVASAAGPSGEAIDQLIFGEVFDVLEVSGGWAWGRCRRDGVVGHVPVPALVDDVLEPTHRIACAEAPVFETPGGAACGAVTLNALVTVPERQGGFVRVDRLGWVAEDQVAGFHAFDSEPAAVAELFLGAPFRPGGRSIEGLDGPGLVQQALFACGMGCPRAADQQRMLGQPAAVDALMRGDLVFWPGHVAMMVDSSRLIHADPDEGVAVAPLASIMVGRERPAACRRL